LNPRPEYQLLTLKKKHQLSREGRETGLIATEIETNPQNQPAQRASTDPPEDEVVKEN